METTTTQSVSPTSQAKAHIVRPDVVLSDVVLPDVAFSVGHQPAGPLHPSNGLTSGSNLTATGVVILGAQRACELEPTVRQECVRSTHAPAPSNSSNSSNSSTSSRSSSQNPVKIWNVEGTATPGAEVWQELVRMLVARESAKAFHPAGRARTHTS